MSGLSSIQGSFFSASNENYAALANLKFDFSLVKVEAPVEFNGIVSALSDRRRVEAEEGPSHKTARRLGSLFEDVVPTTPKLISAYGSRMSEIMNMSGVNDVGADQHGPFKPYVGADGTSLWAAATSGIPALGIYLLSCLLARAWDAKSATAIWVEIIAARRKEIEEGIQNNHNISASAVVGACQDITRKDLSLWDSSARAWLRTADRATQWSQCQLELIVKNISTPIAGGPSTYDQVITVWKRSMLAVEHLLSGKPQDVMDGTIFLAFSAWHLFPDLIVLGAEPKKVEFKDRMFPSSGVGTVGLVSRSSDKNCVQWSLALSHLQYYGEPVVVRSDQECTRVSFAQLQIVALGSLFGAWKIARRDYLLVAEWFKLLWTKMDLPSDYSDVHASCGFGWLLQFVVASDHLLTASDQIEENTRLLEFGKRRGKNFLSGSNRTVSPFFGLLQAPTISGLVKEYDIESGIACLRAIAESLDLNGCDTLICYGHNATYDYKSAGYFELATALPTGPGRHVRWICSNNHIDTKRTFQKSDIHISDRMDAISRQGELCECYATGVTFKVTGEDAFDWLDPPAILAAPQTEHMEPPKSLGFHSIIGDRLLGLFFCKRDDRREFWQTHKRKAEFELSKAIPVTTAVQEFKAAKVVPGRLRDYMCLLTPVSEDHAKRNSIRAPGVAISAKLHKFHPDLTKCFHALEVSSNIYKHLPKATISLKIISRPLFDSAWYTSLFERWRNSNDPVDTSLTVGLISPQDPPLPNRPETLGCITAFDSGIIDLGPEDLKYAFAVCSEDTIYVPTVVLSDPFLQVPEHEMRSIIGNISRPGISILVSPFEPRIRDLSESYKVVKHEPYDLKREDNFRETSLHLSFTDWTTPLTTDDSRTIDHDAQVVEAVISVRDRGHWVADIDILEVDFQGMMRFRSPICGDATHSQHSDLDYTSIDSWEEMLDEPSTVGLFRAHGNWAARLAAVSILSRDGSGGHNFGVLGPEPFCLRCLEEEFEKPGWEMTEYESTLPSFCID